MSFFKPIVSLFDSIIFFPSLISDLKQLKTLGLVYFIHLFLYSGLEFTLTFLMYDKFAFTSKNVGYLLSAMGLTMALLQGGGVRRIPAESTHKFACIVSFTSLTGIIVTNNII